MITEDMKKNTNRLAEHLNANTEKRKIEPKTKLHPDLTESAMKTLMAKKGDDITQHYVDKATVRPRDFFNETSNDETKLAFRIAYPYSTSADYRKKFEGFSGPNEKYQVQVAGDMAHRHMTKTHQAEWLKGDSEQRERMKPQHDFERSYFAHQEAKYNKTPEIEKTFAQTMKDFKVYQSQKPGVTAEQVPVAKQTNAPEPTHQRDPHRTNFAKILKDYQEKRADNKPDVMQGTVNEHATKPIELGTIQSNVERMRQKYGYGNIASKEQVQKNIQTLRR